MDGDGNNHGQKKIAKRSGDRDNTGISAGIFEVIGIKGSRLAPTISEGAAGEKQKTKWQNDGTQRIDVSKRIESQSAGGASSRIPQTVGREGMSELMDANRNNDVEDVEQESEVH